jgi:hypothetical protein
MAHGIDHLDELDPEIVDRAFRRLKADSLGCGDAGLILHAIDNEATQLNETHSYVLMIWELDPDLPERLEAIALAEIGHRP